VTYLTKDRFKQNRKKTFKGHNTAGYACQVNFSPDSKYVMSGKKTRMYVDIDLSMEREYGHGYEHGQALGVFARHVWLQGTHSGLSLRTGLVQYKKRSG
jgi:hypothetical protein